MQVKIPCSSCGKGLKVLPEHLGRRARCPYCQAAIVLEAPPDYVEPSGQTGHGTAVPAHDGTHEARHAIIEALQQHASSLHEWRNNIETLGSVVARHITDGWDKVQQRLDDSQQRQAEQIQAMLEEVRRQKQAPPPPPPPPPKANDELQHALAATLKQQSDSMRTWSEGLAGIGPAIAQQLAAGWEKIQQRLDESHQRQMQEIRSLVAESNQEKQLLLDQAKALHEAQSKQSAATAAALAETATKVHDEVLQLHEAQACSTSADESTQSQEVREALISSLRQHATALRDWSGEIGTLGAVLARQMVEGWEQVQKKLETSHQKQVQEIRTLLSAASEEKRDLLEQSRAIQEAQLQQAAASAASLAETAVKVHEQVLELHAQQAEGTKEMAAAVASELKTVQADLLQRNQEQLDLTRQAVQSLAQQSGQMLQKVNDQAAKLPVEIRSAMEAFGTELHKQLKSTAGEANGLLKGQAATLGELGKSLQQTSERMTSLPEHLTSALQACGVELSRQVKEAAREGQELLRTQVGAVSALSESLKQSIEQMGVLPKHLTDAMQACGAGLTQQVQAANREGQEILRIQAAAVADVSEAMELSAEKLGQLPARMTEALNACAAELRRQNQTAAREGEQAFRSQIAALGEMTQAFQTEMQQATALPGQLLAALDAYRTELHQRAQSAGDQAAEAFQSQLRVVGEVGGSIQQGARQFAEQLEQIRSAYVAELAEAMQRTKQVAVELQKELAAGQEQSTSQLEQLSVSVAVHAQSSARQLAALQQSFDLAATKAMEKVERAKASADEAGAQRLQRLSAEAESLLTEVYRRSEQVLRQSWEMSNKASMQQEAKLTAISDQIVTSLNRAHEALAAPLAAMTALMQNVNTLAPVEQSLSQTLESLTAGDSFKKTLGSLDQSLGRLNRLLQLLSDQVGLSPESADEKQEGMSGWLRRHLAKGGS